MEINQVRLIDEFTKLVAIDSPSYSERQMGDYVKIRLNKLGMMVIEDDAGEKIGGSCGNIYGYLKGSAGANGCSVLRASGYRSLLGESGRHRRGGNDPSRGYTARRDDMAGVARS
jgi:tripeptide aminopeptidase